MWWVLTSRITVEEPLNFTTHGQLSDNMMSRTLAIGFVNSNLLQQICHALALLLCLIYVPKGNERPTG